MSDKESQVLPVAAEPVSKPLDIGTPPPKISRRGKRRNEELALAPELLNDIVAAAQVIRENHQARFLVDRELKERCARLFRTLLPPRPRRPGRKPIASVTRAIRLMKRLRRQFPDIKPARLWARIYPKVIPNYANLTEDGRWNERRRLRDRVHSRKLSVSRHGLRSGPGLRTP